MTAQLQVGEGPGLLCPGAGSTGAECERGPRMCRVRAQLW